MLSNISMILACTSFGVGFYYARKRKLLQQLFNNVDKCQKYQMDFIEDINHLPVDKKMILVGPCILENNTQQPYILKTYIKNKDNEENRLWAIKKFEPNFTLVNPAWQKITVSPDNENDIFAFNLQKSDNIRQGLEQRVITNGGRICCYGKLISQNGNKILQTQILMGAEHDPLLTYLDKQLIKLTKNHHRFVLAGTLLIGGHFLYMLATKQESKYSQILQDIQKKQN